MSITNGLRTRRFETLVVPHMARAYNLARWLSRSDTDAADILQEACVRALQYFDSYRGGDVRAWLLSIVRNTAHTWLSNNQRAVSFSDEIADELPSSDGRRFVDDSNPSDPLHEVVNDHEAICLRRAIATLPVEQREVLILREFEDMSYQQIATALSVPIGTVMSRLSRARDQLATSVKAMSSGAS